MSNDKNRYTELNGDPIHLKSAWMAVAYSPAARVGAMAMAFNATAANTLGNMAASVTYDALQISVVVLTTRFAKNYNYRCWFSEDHKTLAIDMKPDDKTPPTSDINLFAAKKINENVAEALLASASLLLLTLTLMPTIFFPLALTAEFAADYRRFKKICNRKWNITNMPSQETEAEKQKSLTPALDAT